MSSYTTAGDLMVALSRFAPDTEIAIHGDVMQDVEIVAYPKDQIKGVKVWDDIDGYTDVIKTNLEIYREELENPDNCITKEKN